MKKISMLFAAMLVAGYSFNAFAQCVPPAPVGAPGLDPDWQELPCAERGVAYSATINIENLDSIEAGTFGTVTVQSLVVDSIVNLPSGINVTFTPSNNIPPGATACLNVSGTTNDPAGCYLLDIYISVTVNLGALGVQTFSDEARALIAQIEQLTGNPVDLDFTYYTQVIEAGGVCDSNTCLGASIREISSVSDLKVNPNPFNNVTEVSFYAEKPATYFAKIFDVTGKEVFTNQVNVTTGTNKISISRADLKTGVYLFTLTDGRNSKTTRLMVRD